MFSNHDMYKLYYFIIFLIYIILQIFFKKYANNKKITVRKLISLIERKVIYIHKAWTTRR